MLFKQTLKAASAAALWMVALLGSNSAMAAINLDATAAAPNTPVTFAKETLMTRVGNTNFYAVSALAGENNRMVDNPHDQGAQFNTGLPAGDLATTVAIGNGVIALGDDDAIWVRYDLNSHAIFRGTPTMTFLAPPVYPTAAATTGTAASSADASYGVQARHGAQNAYLLYRVSQASGGTASASHLMVVNFGVGADAATVGGHLATSGNGDAEIRVRVFRDGFEAAAGDGITVIDKTQTIFKVGSGVRVVTTSGSATASVDADFRQFRKTTAQPDAPGLVRLGSFDIMLLPHNNADGSTPTAATTAETWATRLGELNIAAPPRSGTMISGDPGFAFGTPTLCNTATPVVHHPLAFAKADEETKAGPVSGGIAYAPWHLCLAVKADNDVPIPSGSYSIDFNFAAASAVPRPFPPVGPADVAFGTIVHDGTTVEIPYLTTYEGYRQRIVIVNRGKKDVGYKLTLMTEDGTTADPGVLEGMAIGGGQTVIKVWEKVTLEGTTTRAAATLTLVSNPGNISVVTTQVNNMDQSTDTVFYH